MSAETVAQAHKLQPTTSSTAEAEQRTSTKQKGRIEQGLGKAERVPVGEEQEQDVQQRSGQKAPASPDTGSTPTVYIIVGGAVSGFCVVFLVAIVGWKVMSKSTPDSGYTRLV